MSRLQSLFHRADRDAIAQRGFPPEIIALAVRWYLRYRLSYADIAELLAERGVQVHRSTIYL
ncbi:MAG: IS6 family transposase [Herpetosiphonaceae bacterium]|nr:IS6 family transposase [Herpetosiphonaceae bacterium]